MELIIDGSVLPEEAAVHDLFARALGLPEWYGRNLDALYDVLTERGEPLALLVPVSYTHLTLPTPPYV